MTEQLTHPLNQNFATRQLRRGMGAYGKAPVLTAEEARTLLHSIKTDTLVGLLDRALIGVMVYSFARVSAATGMSVADYYNPGQAQFLQAA